MRNERLELSKSELLDGTQSSDWLNENVAHPFMNGTGFIQLYNNFSEKKIEEAHVPHAATFSRDWALQNLSMACGAALAYGIAGKAASAGLKKIGLETVLHGKIAGLLTSDTGAQIIGAGLYDLAKSPEPGNTRTGNATGSVIGFGIFSAGNSLLSSSARIAESRFLSGIGRVAVGAAGGLGSLESSRLVSGGFAAENSLSMDDRFKALTDGGFINLALPAVHSGLNRIFKPELRGDSTAGKPGAVLETANKADSFLREKSPSSGEKIDSLPLEQKGLETRSLLRSLKDSPTEQAKAQQLELSQMPLGATVNEKGINFAVQLGPASRAEVLVYDRAGDKVPARIIPMEMSGNIWHVFAEGLPEGTLYQYRADGPFTPDKDGSRFNNKIGLIDPHARAVSSSEIPMSNRDNKAPENLGDMPKAIALKGEYDWQGDRAPQTAMADTIIYELNVRGFTNGAETLGKLKGSYRGLIEKIPHLKELGITAVELMPVMQGDRSPWAGKNPQTGEQLYDSWNYNTVAYKAPSGHLAADGHLGQQVTEFKDMVRALHENKIEVILDVVFNHSREMDASGPTINLRGMDNANYYLLKAGNPAEYLNKTGVGNTLNTNNPLTQDLIVDSLKYWVREMHVDGFRFDLASIFKYETDGSQNAKTSIMERIENDPLLSKTKLIAEPWGPEQYHLGRFSDRLWSEWNGDFRDTVRKFVKSDAAQTTTLAARIAGSPAWFDARQQRYSINGVTFHDGFTLEDLVSYNEKHNLANGENNRDGANDNFSWNSGVEGPLEQARIPADLKAEIAALRSRQTKNLMSLMMLSRGVPHMVAGDEMRRTTFGNNNAWNQDRLNTLDWSLKETNSDFHRFTKMLIELRKSHELGRLNPDSFIWHGVEPFKPDFADYARFIAWQTRPTSSGVRPLYSAFNSYWEPISVKLPSGNWYRLVDTNLPSGQDIVSPDKAVFIDGNYTIQPRSGIVLEGR